MKKLVLAFSFLILGSCSDDNLPKYSNLDGLRILAIDVDTPEVNPPAGGGVVSVQITPYLSDIGGTGNISLEIQSCLDPGVSIGASPSCSSASYASTVQNATATFADAERTGSPTGAIGVNLTVPAGLLAAYSNPLQNNGVAYLITMRAVRGADSVTSFRRVLMSTKTPNQNPTLSDLLSGGSSLTSLPSSKVELGFSAGSAPETYQFMNSEEVISTETETFELTWFISDGEISAPRTFSGETTSWTPPATAPTGRQSVVVGVLRDGRGGVDVLIKKF